jgi:2-C-methyl-D-erythritol 4-phosphate cytidylyltransferase
MTPKQFVLLRGKPLLLHVLRAFRSVEGVGPIVVVVSDEHQSRARKLIRAAGLERYCAVVTGGKRRQDSVFNGLKGFEVPPKIVLVHDAARPLITRQTISAILRLMRRYKAVTTALPVTDTLKKEIKPGYAGWTIPRSGLWSAQTPQGFDYNLLVKAHKAARRSKVSATDDSMLVERLGVPVRILAGEARNIKVTTKADLKLAALWMKHGY